MSYYWFNRKEIFQKGKKDIPKKNLLSIIYQTIKESSENRHKNLSEEEKDKIKEYQRQKY